MVIGDVSGHGLKSALVMAQARAFLRAFCRTIDGLAGVMNLLNDFLARDMTSGHFMTMFLGAFPSPFLRAWKWFTGKLG